MSSRPIFRTLLLIAATILLGVTFQSIQAQPDTATCSALVERALAELGNNCGGLSRNSACYGFNRVDATFGQQVAEDFFSSPADRAELAAFRSISTSPLDLAESRWGIAVMSVQANIPDTLPGQAVTFMLLGDTEVENAVDPESVTGQTVTAISQSETSARSAPSVEANSVGIIQPGLVMQVDGQSADGGWLRVNFPGGSAWISREAVNPTPLLDDLPVVEAARQTPMQAFYFRTGPGQTACNQMPSALAIQSPENLQIDLTANGANIRLGSTIILRILPPGNIMQLIVLEGKAVLNPGTPDEIEVLAGSSTTRCLSDPENLGIDGQDNDREVGDDCPWTPPAPLTDEELLIAQTVLIALQALNPPPVPADECPFGSQIVHIVSPGENLFRISQRYRTGMGAIAQANGLGDPNQIAVGTALVIPCGVDTGLPSVPPTPQQPDGVPPPLGVDCGSFRATSPLDGLNYGQNTFYWDPAPGATGYRVNIYNVGEQGGALAASYDTGGDKTSLTADITHETVGFGFSFAWEVQALINGQVACTSTRYTVPRGVPPPGPTNPPSAPMTASWSCSGVYQFTVTYTNLPPGTTSVTISFTNGLATPGPGSTFPPIGSHVFLSFGPSTSLSGFVIANPSGQSAPILPPSISC